MSTSAIDFVLTHLESSATLSQLATVYNQDAMAPIVRDAAGVLYLSQTQVRDIFKFRTDAADVIDAAAEDIEYYVYDDKFTELEINPANAMMNKPESFSPIALSGKETPYPDNKCLVAHDFVRHLALDLFGSHIGVDIFNNELALVQNIRTKCGNGEEDVMGVINAAVKKVSVTSTETDFEGLAGEAGSKYMTNANTTAENLCRELFNQMISLQPARFAGLDETSDDSVPRPLPFLAGDSINFKLTINPGENQHVFIRGESGEPVASRIYEIRLKVVSDEPEETEVNTAVAPDELAE